MTANWQTTTFGSHVIRNEDGDVIMQAERALQPAGKWMVTTPFNMTGYIFDTVEEAKEAAESAARYHVSAIAEALGGTVSFDRGTDK